MSAWPEVDLSDDAEATPATAPTVIEPPIASAMNKPISVWSVRSGPRKGVLCRRGDNLDPRPRVAADQDALADGRINEQERFRFGQPEALGQFRNRARRLAEEQLDGRVGDHRLA